MVHSVQYATPVPDNLDHPLVPEDLRDTILSNLTGCYRIVIGERVGRADKVINTLDLTCAAKEEPAESPEEICEAVMRCMVAHAMSVVEDLEDDEAAPEEIPFRVMQYIRPTKKGGRAKRPSFSYKLPIGEDDAAYQGETVRDEASFDDPRFEAIMFAMEKQDAREERLVDQNERLMGRLLESTKFQNACIEPLQHMCAYLGQTLSHFFPTWVAANAAIYDTKRVEAEEKGKERRQEQLLKYMGPAAKEMADQFGTWARGKMGGDVPAAMGPAPANGAGAAIEVEEVSVELTNAQRENPLATVARGFGDTLQSPQWFSLMDVLTKKQLALLRAVIQSESDVDLIAAWDAMAELPAEKLLDLHKALDEGQQADFNSLAQAIDASKAAAKQAAAPPSTAPIDMS